MNMKTLTSYHSIKLLDKYNNNKNNSKNDKKLKQCNCRNGNTCPLNGEYLTNNVVYNVNVKRGN